MRLAFLDESGVGSIRNDTHVIIAGVIVNADGQVLSLQKYLKAMLEDLTPKGVVQPTHFHAKDIFWGTNQFDKKQWSEGLRREILRELGSLPSQFDLPVVWGVRSRVEFRKKFPDMLPQEQLIGCYSIAATIALIQIEKYMREGPVHDDEVACVFFEHNSQIHKRARDSFRYLRKPEASAIGEVAGIDLPLQKIFDTPTFQEKNDASLLQLADYCAFARKRHVQQLSDGDFLWGPLADNCVMLYHSEMDEN